MRTKFGIALVGLLVLAPMTVRAQTTSPPSQKIVGLSDFRSIGIPTAHTSNIVLSKGKKKTLILLQVTLIAHAYEQSTIVITPKANAFDIGPAPAVHYCDTPTGDCTVSAAWWLDVDAAEAAHPGAFVSQPVSIDVTTSLEPSGSASGASIDTNISITAQTIKR